MAIAVKKLSVLIENANGGKPIPPMIINPYLGGNQAKNPGQLGGNQNAPQISPTGFPPGLGTSQQGVFTPPTIVRLKGWSGEIRNINALQLLDLVVRSFDHPKGMRYVIMPYGVVIAER